MDKLRKRLLNNKDDLIEGTFGHTLFEKGLFDGDLLDVLIRDLEEYAKISRNDDSEIRDLLLWIVEGVDLCFSAHHDENDLFRIGNYSAGFEERWRGRWKVEIEKYTRTG